VPPPVAPAPQVRRARAAVGAQRDRHLAGTQPVQRGLDDHLARELHAGGAQVEPEDRLAVEPAQPAVEVADAAAEEHPPEERQHGVAEVAVQRGHGVARDPALEPVAHHELVAGAQAFHERADRGEVVAAVGVGHDDVAAARRLDAAHQRGAVPLLRDLDDARAGLLGERLRAVGAAVVGDEDLARGAGVREAGERGAYAGGDRLRLVEARHEHRDLDGGLGHAGSPQADGEGEALGLVGALLGRRSRSAGSSRTAVWSSLSPSACRPTAFSA